MTDPAPTTASSPMVTPGQTITPPPSQTLSPIVNGFAYEQRVIAFLEGALLAKGRG
jgi:hypothetical protein